MPRFVVLHHTLPAGSERQSHWDLMFEVGDSLRTWALANEPDRASEGDALELADHRLAYLDYEGPVSGNRGIVDRWDAGDFQLIEASDDCWRADLDGARLRGPVTLVRLERESHSWRVSFGTAPTRS